MESISDDDIVEVIIAAASEEWLLGFTRQLVEQRLVACGHHTPIRSIFTWDGHVQDERETRVAMHTRAHHIDAIIDATNAVHPYDVACVIALPIRGADPAYRAWILDSTGSKTS